MSLLIIPRCCHTLSSDLPTLCLTVVDYSNLPSEHGLEVNETSFSSVQQTLGLPHTREGMREHPGSLGRKVSSPVIGDTREVCLRLGGHPEEGHAAGCGRLVWVGDFLEKLPCMMTFKLGCCGEQSNKR